MISSSAPTLPTVLTARGSRCARQGLVTVLLLENPLTYLPHCARQGLVKLQLLNEHKLGELHLDLGEAWTLPELADGVQVEGW